MVLNRISQKVFKHISILMTMANIQEKITLFMKKLKEIPDFDRVKFVILFGSFAEGKQTPLSDYDFVVYYEGDSDDRFQFRIQFGAKLPEKFDLHVFQDLPLYVRKEVFRGKLIYFKDMDFVYEAAYQTIREYEDFKKHYYDYIKMERMR